MGNALLTGVVFVAIISTWAAIVAAVLLHAAANPRFKRRKAEIAAVLSRPAPIDAVAPESESRPLAG